MDIVGIVPARYSSTRLPGKPIADICGYPMIWWVFNEAKKVEEFSNVIIATDDERISEVCRYYNMDIIMTTTECPNHIHRIWEVSEKISADYYVSINGDEPLVSADDIRKVIPLKCSDDREYFGSLYRNMSDPAEVLDLSNVKIVLNSRGECIYQSRNPIPSTKGAIEFKFKKAIGIECFNKKALDFFVGTPRGSLETIEDIDHLRFIENGKIIRYVEVQSESLSVDTQKDLERVRKVMKELKG